MLRRELVVLERGKTKADVTYQTTDRFLEVFGLRGLDELPRAEELDFKGSPSTGRRRDAAS